MQEDAHVAILFQGTTFAKIGDHGLALVLVATTVELAHLDDRALQLPGENLHLARNLRQGLLSVPLGVLE